MATREGRIQVEGGSIWYKRLGSEKNPALVLLHGGPGYPHDYLEPLAELSDAWQIIFYDQLGCGSSDRPKNSSLWTIGRFCFELATVLQALNLSKAHIFGHSWGTVLAVEYYKREPERVASMILASPCLSMARWLADAAALRSMLPDSVRGVLERCEREGALHAPEYQKATAEYYRNFVCRRQPKPEPVLRSDAKAGVDVYVSMWGPNEFVVNGSLSGYDCTADLPAISVPALLTCGLLDEAQPETCRDYAELIPGAQLEIFNNSSHMPHWEEKTRYLQALREFLTSLP